MEKYRVKRSPAVIVEAALLDEDNVDELANLTQAQIIQEGKDRNNMREGLNVKTPNGKERLHQGMYLVKVGADFYTMAAVNFEARYELLATAREDDSSHEKMTDDPWKGVPRIKDVP